MKILMLSATATALRFQLLEDKRVMAHGLFSRLGTAGAYLEITTDDEPYSESVRAADHQQALRSLVDYLQRNEHIQALRDIELVVHRVPHGGTVFKHHAVVEHETMGRFEAIAHLSPDNPACIKTVSASLRQLGAINVAVFDTAFLTTIPPEATRYAVSADLAKRFHFRRYGAYGILHKAAYDDAMLHVRGRAKRPRRVVTVIIDDDVSVTATLDGIAVETSTGFTVAEGLPGMHRSGTLDPRIPLHLATHLRASAQQVDRILSTSSGLYSMTAKRTYDELVKAAQEKDIASVEALMMLSYRIAKEIAAMTAALGGIDMIVFCGPQATWMVREEVCRRLSAFKVRYAGLKRHLGVLSKPGSSVLIVGVEVDETSAVLRDAQELYRLRKNLKRTH